jgi:CRISPR-associated protein Csm1
VDGLGKVFTEFGKDTPTRYIAASHTMSLFFDGYVSQLCQAFENEYGRSDSLYIIYGGGDDLFIVGEWDLLPHLAQKIHDDFAVFTQERHSISAAIVLIQADDPFHRAAAEAGAALDAAKGVSPEKNRLYFLGEAFTWRDGGQWQIVVQEQKRLLDISKKIDRPQAITRHLTALYNTWARDLRHRQHPDKLYYGPYLWRAAYQLKRLQEEYDKQGIKGDLQELQANLIKPETMGLSGVIARWAELYIRATKKEN